MDYPVQANRWRTRALLFAAIATLELLALLAVGSVVPWARAGVGAVATQAKANYNYGPHGIELMARGKTADETVEGLISADEDREHRQISVVDARDRAATFTDSECFE